jgi:hypothetical protein
MNTRQLANRSRIEFFLQRLGERFRHPARLYLVGGTTMVYEGFREQSLDIDLTIDVPPADHAELIQAIRALKDELALNVEEASPGDFIPLPKGYRERAQFIGRFGSLDVFHFDLYSTALSKIARGTEEDLSDVSALLRARRITMTELERYWEEIRPRIATESLNQDANEMARNFQSLHALLKRD